MRTTSIYGAYTTRCIGLAASVAAGYSNVYQFCPMSRRSSKGLSSLYFKRMRTKLKLNPNIQITRIPI